MSNRPSRKGEARKIANYIFLGIYGFTAAFIIVLLKYCS